MGECLEKYIKPRLRSNLLFFFLGLLIAATVGLTVALIVQGGKKATDIPEKEDDCLCTSPSCVLRAGQLVAGMDRNVDPCTDFFHFACGNWIRTHNLPAGISRFNRHAEVREIVKHRIKDLLEKPYDKTTDNDSIRKAKTLYKSCVDEDALTSLGVEPLKRLVYQLGTWPLTSPSQFKMPMDLNSALVNLALVGVSPLLEISVTQERQNSSQHIIQIDHPVYGIPRSFLIEGRQSEVVSEYEALLEQLAMHVLGLSSAPDLSRVVQFEVDLAKVTPSKAQRRDSSKFYKKLTVSELQKAVPQFMWLDYLISYFQPVNIKIEEFTEVDLYAEDYLNSMMDMYTTSDHRVVANFMLMRAIYTFYNTLAKDIRELDTDLNEAQYGITQREPRWKTCVNRIHNDMASAEGQLYVSNYFPPSAKQKAAEIIRYIRESMGHLIRDVPWMDDATKVKAQGKLRAIVQKVAYPDYQFNDTYIDDTHQDVTIQNGTYFQNVLNLARSKVRFNSLKLTEAPSRSRWYFSAATVNAHYSSSRNAITIPAGILNVPWYDGDYPMAMMFGGIGSMVGHEITHGFDDNGRRYDKSGNAIPWWSNSSVAGFEKRAKCFVDQYSEHELAGLHVNGKLTLGENIADNGGLRSSFMAFENWQQIYGKPQSLPGLGFSSEQVFFVSYAQGWCTKNTDAATRNRILTNPHSPDQFRVNVPLQNFDKFAEAFRCPAGSPMNPANKCRLW